MTRILLLAPVLALAAAPAAAQLAPAPAAPPPAPPLVRGAVFQSVEPDGPSLEAMVARLMSFDRNGDGRLTIDELPERMESLLARGDINRDGALDVGEVRRMARLPRQMTAVNIAGTSGRYGFADELHFSSRDHIEGALDDLKLAGPVADDARVVAGVFVDRMEAQARADLLEELGAVLSTGELASFERSLDQLQARAQQRVVMIQGTPTVEAMASALRTASAQNIQVNSAVVGAVASMGSANLLLNAFRLSPQDRARAEAAVNRYTTRLRPGDADWTPLLAALEPLLADDERDDLRAALDRRPVVPLTGVFTFTTGLVR